MSTHALSSMECWAAKGGIKNTHTHTFTKRASHFKQLCLIFKKIISYRLLKEDYSIHRRAHVCVMCIHVACPYEHEDVSMSWTCSLQRSVMDLASSQLCEMKKWWSQMTLGLCSGKIVRTQHKPKLLVLSQPQMLKSIMLNAKNTHLPQSPHPLHRGKDSSNKFKMGKNRSSGFYFVHKTKTIRALMK